jgi:hypothetical protein
VSIIRFIEPMLLLQTDKLPEGAAWLHEVKLDGYGAIAGRSGNSILFRSRRDNDFTRKFPSIANAFRETFQPMNDPSIVILDEFDRLDDEDIERKMADTIKTLSDNSIEVTLIIVGVADSVDQLIGEHQSIDRAIVVWLFTTSLMAVSRSSMTISVRRAAWPHGLPNSTDAFDSDSLSTH